MHRHYDVMGWGRAEYSLTKRDWTIKHLTWRGGEGCNCQKIAWRHLWTTQRPLAFGTYYSYTLSLMSTYLTKQLTHLKMNMPLAKGLSLQTLSGKIFTSYQTFQTHLSTLIVCLIQGCFLQCVSRIWTNVAKWLFLSNF